MKKSLSTNEISRHIPAVVREKFGGSALFTAYGCVLLELESRSGYAYKALNLSTGRSAIIHRRTNPLTTSGAVTIAEKIKQSSIAGMGRYEIDMPAGSRLSYDGLKAILLHIFEEILPEYGFVIREKQVELAEHILAAFDKRSISLSEAEVGIGKTLAYLLAAILVKRGRLNDLRLRGIYPGQSYAAGASMPIIITTSSIALQTAIACRYLPSISKILLEQEIIGKPVTCVIRKAKEHYVCERNLRTFLKNADACTKYLLSPLLEQNASIDLGASGLTPYIKRRIGVSGNCGESCPHEEKCRYLRHMNNARSCGYDFQITNHNYFIADIIRRSKGQSPLIPDYQGVIIDEGHKLLQAARQMYGVEIGSFEVPEITADILGFSYKHGQSGEESYNYARQLYGQNARLFDRLDSNIADGEDHNGEALRFKTVTDAETSRHLRGIRRTCGDLSDFLFEAAVLNRYKGRRKQILRELKALGERAGILERRRELVCWIEKDSQTSESRLCAIPKDLNTLLYRDLWSKEIPIILTSGTLSAGGSFEHLKRTIGLDILPLNQLMETSKPSPFDYEKNALIYISQTVPFPDVRNSDYVDAVSDEVEALIMASCGHAAVLFTSYKMQGLVYAALKKRGLPFPFFKLERGDSAAIEHFKQSGNGVLFASGTMWEGIDIPGDALSMLIMVKLPFPAPNPIGEYEKTKYGSMAEYKTRVITPEMLIKAKQGSGRPIRTETDTAAIAILDCRVRPKAPYHRILLDAMPKCRVTYKISDVRSFFVSVKPVEYFE